MTGVGTYQRIDSTDTTEYSIVMGSVSLCSRPLLHVGVPL
jgi:hypothetical protein